MCLEGTQKGVQITLRNNQNNDLIVVNQQIDSLAIWDTSVTALPTQSLSSPSTLYQTSLTSSFKID